MPNDAEQALALERIDPTLGTPGTLPVSVIGPVQTHPAALPPLGYAQFSEPDTETAFGLTGGPFVGMTVTITDAVPSTYDTTGEIITAEIDGDGDWNFTLAMQDDPGMYVAFGSATSGPNTYEIAFASWADGLATYVLSPIGSGSTGGSSGTIGPTTGTLAPPETVAVVIQAEGQAFRFRSDGVDPTATVGMNLPAGSTMTIYGVEEIADLRLIEAASGGILNVQYYGGAL